MIDIPPTNDELIAKVVQSIPVGEIFDIHDVIELSWGLFKRRQVPDNTIKRKVCSLPYCETIHYGIGISNKYIRINPKHICPGCNQPMSDLGERYWCKQCRIKAESE